MAQTSNYTCDVCGVTRGPENHWLISTSNEFGITVYPWASMLALTDHAAIDPKDIKHLCGQGCASKLLSQTVEGWL